MSSDFSWLCCLLFAACVLCNTHITDRADDSGKRIAGVDKHALYQQTVQYPPGDIHWMNKFYRRYIGPQVMDLEQQQHAVNGAQ